MTDRYNEHWNREEVVQFFAANRNKGEDLYPSEQYFLDRFMTEEMIVLDFGCAAGGFTQVLRQRYQLPENHYWGVDQSSQMVNKARSLYHKAHFNTSLNNLPSSFFDLVYSFGTLHMTLEWENLIKQLYDLTRRYLIFDLRVTKDHSTVEDLATSFQTLNFFDQKIEAGNVPYVVVNEEDCTQRLRRFMGKHDQILTYGYQHRVSQTVTSPFESVHMMVYCIIKQ